MERRIPIRRHSREEARVAGRLQHHRLLYSLTMTSLLIYLKSYDITPGFVAECREAR